MRILSSSRWLLSFVILLIIKCIPRFKYQVVVKSGDCHFLDGLIILLFKKFFLTIALNSFIIINVLAKTSYMGRWSSG